MMNARTAAQTLARSTTARLMATTLAWPVFFGCAPDIAAPDDIEDTDIVDEGIVDDGIVDADIVDDGNGQDDDTEADDMTDPVFVAEAQSGTALEIEQGQIEGVADGNLRVFKGIPYAEAPIGNLRFKPPVKKEDWDGARPTDAFGPNCPQQNLTSLVLGDSGFSEDCLSLNVWAHDDDNERPVMVFIYGGAFIMGSTGQPLYDGANLARRGDVTVVTINYRLGALGWLASADIAEDLGEPAAGNYGIYDQIEALRWVKNNIRAFGGDPDNVTIFGESAGAISVCALLGTPSADDLFHKAIIESGMCTLATYDEAGLIGMPSASELAEAVVEEVGCSDAFNVADCLRSKTTDELVAATSLFDVIQGDMQAISALSPIVDGVLIKKQPIERMRDGEINKPIIVGSNKDEGVLFTAADIVATRFGLENKIEELMGEGPHVDELMDLYSFWDFPIVKDAWTALLGEAVFICPGLEVAKAANPNMPVYTYHFERTPLLMAAVGAIHALELPYVFDNFGAMALIPTNNDENVSEAMQGAWSSFARYGTPSLDVGWAPYTADNPNVIIFDNTIEAVDDIRDGRCDALKALGIVQ